jgi:transcription elongation factor Elf1
MGYKRTRRVPVGDYTEFYDVDLSNVSLTGTNDVRRIQIVHVPDDRHQRDIVDDETLAAGDAHEVLVREPVEIINSSPKSGVSMLDGPYGRENALSQAGSLARDEDLPVAEEIVTLRPDHWTDANHWATCPACSSEELVLVSDLDHTNLTLACRSCDERAESETDRKEMHSEWFHCPGCGSGDVRVELSGPSGATAWSCDDCGYDTVPAPPDHAYAEVRDTSHTRTQ